MAVKTSFLVSLLFKKVREEGGSCILVPTSNHLAVVDIGTRQGQELIREGRSFVIMAKRMGAFSKKDVY